jgi:type III pantothenate kinase
MLLCIDSGNTNIVFAVFDDDDNMLEKWRTSSNSNRTADEFEVLLGQLISSSNITVDDINACIIASVVPATLNTLKSLCRDYFSCEPMVIGEAGVELGIEIKVDQPNDVGADRLVNAVSA